MNVERRSGDQESKSASSGFEGGLISTPASASRNNPVVTFSGMDLSLIIEEAKSQEMIRSRFKQAPILDTGKELDKIMQEIQTANPDLTTFCLLQLVADVLPGKMPIEAYERAIQTLANMDSNTRKAGEKSFLFLNAKTILSVIRNFTLDKENDEQERDELAQFAIVTIMERFAKLHTKYAVTIQIHTMLTHAIALYIAKRDNLPTELLRNPNYKLIKADIQEVVANSVTPITQNDLDSLIVSLSEKYQKVTTDTFSSSLNALTSPISLEEADQELHGAEDEPFEDVQKAILKENVDDILDSLTDQERRVIQLRYGLLDGQARTPKEIGKEYGIIPQGIQQIEEKVLKKLRHLSRFRRLISYSTLSDYRPESQDLADIPYLSFQKNLDNLRESSFAEISDFFKLPPEEIAQNWKGKNLAELSRMIIILLDSVLAELYRQVAKASEFDFSKLSDFNKQSFWSITDAVLDRDRQAILSNLTPIERAVMQTEQDQFNSAQFTEQKVNKFSSMDYSKKSVVEINVRRKLFIKAYKELRGLSL